MGGLFKNWLFETSLVFFVLCILVVGVWSVPITPQTLDTKELEFDRWWSTYLLKKHGCPVVEGKVAVPLTSKDCIAPKEIDMAARAKAAKLAKEIF